MTTGIPVLDYQIYCIKQIVPKIRKRASIVRFFRQNPSLVENDPELARAVRYIKYRGLAVFPYSTGFRYSPWRIRVFSDDDSGFKYVMHEGKRLFFPKAWDALRIRKAYAALLREQDERSAHRYLTPSFDVTPETVLFDIGSAEGMLSLSVVERVAAIHLFEMSEEWLEPLRLTFSPWKEKVHIVRKYVSDTNDDDNVTVDSYISSIGIKPTALMLKMDVEGAESKVVAGSSNTLASTDIMVSAVICTYHKHGDEETLSAIMRANRFDVKSSQGYMLFLYDREGLSPPYFRKGLIYCTKQ